MSSALVDLQIDPRGVATIRLTSPANRNALSRRLLVELGDALRATAEDAAVRVVVLTAEGSVFSSGADLKEQQDGRGPGPIELPQIVTAMFGHPRPIVARINGAARAGGLGLALAADITIGQSDATFSFSEVRLGVVPAMIAVPVLRRVSPTVAHELFLTGATFDGNSAEQWGLLNRAAPTDRLDGAVSDVVEQLLLGGPSALAATKQLRDAVTGRSLPEALEHMRVLSATHFSSEEGQAGIAAFRSKTSPPWVSPPTA